MYLWNAHDGHSTDNVFTVSSEYDMTAFKHGQWNLGPIMLIYWPHPCNDECVVLEHTGQEAWELIYRVTAFAPSAPGKNMAQDCPTRYHTGIPRDHG